MSRKQLRKIGNSTGVIIPFDVLEILRWRDGQEIEFELEAGNRLVISKPKPKPNLFGANQNGNQEK